MEYLLKASAVITIFYICYKLFLQRDTFFETNRGFLLTGLITAFTIPLIVIPIYIEQTPVLLDTYIFNDAASLSEKSEQTFTLLQLLYTIYILGVIFFFIRFLIQLLSLTKLIFLNEKEKQGHYTFIKTTNKISPFSFFNWIVYNPDLFNKNELEQIITHEKVHVRQHHSIDILLTQLSSIILWFNPFVWFYIKDLKQNLEFIADQNAQNKSDCKKSYQYTLLKTSMPTHQLALTNNFYNSLIKKRIVMLHKSKSKKINQLKYVLVIPILGIFLMSFNTKNVYIEKEIPISENSFISNSFIKDALITNDDIINKKEVIKNKSTTKSSIKKPAVINTKTYKKIVKTTGIIDIVLITKKFTDADFKKITNNLKKKGVTIKFKGIKRNKDNEITAIKIDISSKNSSANYSISSDEAIKPIKISFNEDDESISIGNGSARHVHGDNVYTFKTKGKKHKIHKSGKGTNTFVFSHDDDDHKIHIVNEDTIIHTSHGKKGKHRMIKKSKHVKIISDDSDENIEVIIESYNGKEPLYILNGKEIKKEKFENIEGNDIKNVSVLKGDDAIKKYGNKAKDGVIEITTKKKN